MRCPLGSARSSRADAFLSFAAVCQKTLVGSETAMSGHVAQHFEAPAKKKKPKVSSGATQGAGKCAKKKR